MQDPASWLPGAPVDGAPQARSPSFLASALRRAVLPLLATSLVLAAPALLRLSAAEALWWESVALVALSAALVPLVSHRRQASRGRALLGAVTALSAPVRLAEALDTALLLLGKAAGARYVVLHLPGPDGAHLELAHVIDTCSGRLDVAADPDLERGAPPSADAASRRRPFIVEDISAMEAGHPLRALAGRLDVRSLISIPLQRPVDGVLLGTLAFTYSRRQRFSTTLVQFLHTAAAPICGALANASVLEEFRLLNEQLEERVIARTRELLQAQQQVLRASRLSAMGELAAGIAHELNTPLGTIAGYAQFAEERLASAASRDEGVARYLGIIRQETDRCSKIVRGLLHFTRASSTDSVPTEIGALVEHAVQLVHHHLDMHLVRVTTARYRTPCLVDARPDQLIQVFTNVLINAQQAMPQGGDVQISVGPAAHREDFVAVTFADRGPGIPAEHMDRIFEPFFTTKPVGQGTGLGLSISYGIVRQHGGNIEVESMAGQGTVLRILLPVAGQPITQGALP